MTTRLLLALTCLALLGAPAPSADLTGAYDGSLVAPRSAASASLAAAFAQRGAGVTGTVAVTTATAGLSGIYRVRGKVHGHTVVLAGVGPGGVRLKWDGKVRGDALRGKARLGGRAGRLRGVLTFVRRGAEPPAQPRQSCDNTFFDGQVMGRVLKPICANCHVAGGAAEATNFRVTPNDPLATQQSIAGLIDIGDPEHSRILEKPLAEIPHGGGQQLERSSVEFQILEFIARVKEVFNDALLVDREDYRDESLDRTRALYDEPLELIAYLVKNDRPLTEMGTADYTVMNDQFENTPRMPYPHEPVTGPDFQPTHYTDGRPHAGVLSTSAFYQVWTTNGTNKNRRRANRLSILFHCYNFLDTPVDV